MLMEPVTSGHGFKVETVTLEGIFRIVQAIYSPRAEVFKRWLARVGQERKIRPNYKTDLDTIFSMLGEAATASIVCRQDGQGDIDDGFAVCTGKRIAGEARARLVQEAGEGEEGQSVTNCHRLNQLKEVSFPEGREGYDRSPSG